MRIDLLRCAGRGLRAGWLLLLVLTLFGLGASIAAAGDVPMDEAGFTTYMAKAFGNALPGWAVKVIGPLRLDLKGPDRQAQNSYLYTVYSLCRRNPPRCDDAVRSHVEQMSATYKLGDVPPDRASLRAVIRQADYVEQMRKAYAGKGFGEPVGEPLIAGLWMVCAQDLPEAIQYLNPKDLKKLGMSRDEAIGQCKANTAKTLRPLAGLVRKVPVRKIGLITDDPYESSRLLRPEEWAPVAAEARGKLIVAVPATDVVLYAFHTDKKTVQLMRSAINAVAATSNRPLSPEVFRWTKKGWKVLPP